MPCYHPLAAWYARDKTVNGKRGLTFTASEAWTDKPLDLPCGRCIGCRLERARQWAIRCMHEAQQHDTNWFATLTYDPDHLPPGGTLRPIDYTLFMKRLRKARPDGVRFFQCGEYGEALQRPHHHALLFGVDFPDKRLLPRSDPQPLYHSQELDNLWKQGTTTIGAVTFESAGYVARYSLKKITGPPAEAHYAGRVPEYGTMSRRPGIGATWLDQYRTDVYPEDAVTIRGGRKCRPPRYYDNATDQDLIRPLKAKRKYRQLQDPNNTGKRLIVREAVATAALNLKTRSYE